MTDENGPEKPETPGMAEVSAKFVHEAEAAEKVCGGPLIAGGKLGQLRAIVSPLDNPNDKTTFRDQNP